MPRGRGNNRFSVAEYNQRQRDQLGNVLGQINLIQEQIVAANRELHAKQVQLGHIRAKMSAILNRSS